jgi:hypothetical protein
MTRPLIIFLSLIVTLIAFLIFQGVGNFWHLRNVLFVMLSVIILMVLILDIFILDSGSKIINLLKVTQTKRVYTTYGRFYITIRGDVVSLYQDKLFFLNRVGHNYFDQAPSPECNIQFLKTWIKQDVDRIYARDIEGARIKAERAKNVSVINAWNGCIDKQTERDKKLNDII